MMPTTQQELQAIIDGEGEYAAWESSGYDCFMLRTSMQSWCGYVTVPPEHPWSGLSYEARVSPLPERDVPDAAMPVLSMFIAALHSASSGEPNDGRTQMDFTLVVHGGVTWASERRNIQGELPSDTRWTFGFDTAHAGDLVPGVAFALPAALRIEGDVYRDRDYVFAETSRLAAQLRMVQQRGYL